MRETSPFEPKLVPIADLRRGGWQERSISPARLASLARSIEADPEMLWLRPPVADEDGNVYMGRARVEAAGLLGWDQVPVVFAVAPEVVAKARALRDNNQWSDWEDDPLAVLIRELYAEDCDLSSLGFDEDELARLLEAEVQPLVDPEALPPPQTEIITRPGDRIELGDHVIVCGDAREAAPYEDLFGSTSADAIIADGPYGLDYVGKTRARLRIANDSITELAGLLDRSLAACDAVLRPGAPIYLWAPSGPNFVLFAQAFESRGWQLRQSLVWVKGRLVLGHGDYHYAHEMVLFGYKKPLKGGVGRGRTGWYGGNAASSVLNAPSPHASPNHPTPKPVSILETLIRNSTRRGELVLDPFLGSGSTLVAAEMLGRRCYGIEIEPRYVDVAVARWEMLTGRKAVRPQDRSRGQEPGNGPTQVDPLWDVVDG